MFLGSRSFESEELLAFELGYRGRLTDRFFLDVATFYHDYDKIFTPIPDESFLETSPAPEHLVISYVADNSLYGETCGVEWMADWQVLDRWCLQAAYTYLRMHLHAEDIGEGTISEGLEGESPGHQLFLRSSMDLPGKLSLNLAFRYVDKLPSIDVARYRSLDAHLAWHQHDHLEIFIVGQNLLDDHHSEFKPLIGFTLPTGAERGGYGAIRWRF